MSSVTRFIRQIPLATTYYGIGAVAPTFYEFVPGAGNYVGNYPPGTMQELAVALPEGAILRDMGKTVKTTIGDAAGAAFFRQVQVLVPTTYEEVGNVPETFGVRGAPSVPSGFAPYYSLYVRTTVAGFGSNSGLYPIIGGQM